MAANTEKPVASIATQETTPMLKFRNTKTNQNVEMKQSTYERLVNERYPLEHLEKIS